MPRGRQPRQGKRNRRGAKPARPLRVQGQPAVSVVVPISLTTSNGTTNLLVTSIASTLLTSTRFAAAAALFYNVAIRAVSIEPYNLSAAQYVEWAATWTHIPYLASTGDVVPSAATSAAKVLTLPGAKNYQQGNGSMRRVRISGGRVTVQSARITTDLPTVLFLHSYSTADVNWNIFFQCRFSGYIPSV